MVPKWFLHTGITLLFFSTARVLLIYARQHLMKPEKRLNVPIDISQAGDWTHELLVDIQRSY